MPNAHDIFRLADRQLLGPLHSDHMYLRSLINHPLWKAKEGFNADEEDNRGRVTKRAVSQCFI